MSGNFVTPQREVRKRKSDTLRKCPNCSGNILPAERRYPCAGRSFECPTKPLPDTVLQAAHYYHLFKSMRTGSWAKTGYIAPHNFSKQRIRAMFDGREQWFSIRSSPVQHSFSVDAVEYFIFRCECAHHYWRDERAMLMGTRMELWAAGVDQQKVCDCLGITRESLKWLDAEIRHFVWFPYWARIEMLHLDHVQNDGARHRRKHQKAGGVHTYQWVVKHPKQARKRLQILCANHDRMKQKLGSIDAIVEREEQEERF